MKAIGRFIADAGRTVALAFIIAACCALGIVAIAKDVADVLWPGLFTFIILCLAAWWVWLALNS